MINKNTQTYDVIIIGAGAAGLFCAAEAGKRGRRVLLLDHAKKLAEKIRISGGGRCNFTNLHVRPDCYLSQNPHFCKSALRQYTAQDFIDLVKRHGIAFHEKTLGQLFCDGKSQQIIDMLVREIERAAVTLEMQTPVHRVEKDEQGYRVVTDTVAYACRSLVIATGGLSIPKIGATDFGYRIAKQFGLTIVPTRAGLVPLTFDGDMLAWCKDLSGVSVDARVQYQKTFFEEGLLFTHRGLSGPSILQISSYWQDGDSVVVNLKPDVFMADLLKQKKHNSPKQHIVNALAEHLPKRLSQSLCTSASVEGVLTDISHKKLETLGKMTNAWPVYPVGSEGYRTAEVTLGGVDTDDLSSKTMESRGHKGLFFIGEVVDVTGHLGGYNFQWAWSSGFVAGQYV